MAENKIKAASCFDKIKTRGRPKLILNETGKNILITLFSIMCTEEEAAACLDVTVDTLHNADNNDAFLECKKKGMAVGKKSLRRIQFNIAKKGNATMAIWLGKQWLGQKDDAALLNDADDGKTVIVDDVPLKGEEYVNEKTDIK